MTEALQFQVEWLDAPGVITPELAATWARYQIWAGGRCITQVEATGATFRRSVYGSLYPLAEWIAANWWFLTSSVRPSAIDSRYWTWPNVGAQQWLQYHNMRGAGDGMAWPDVTLVPEGAATCIRWAPDGDEVLGPVRFISIGRVFVSSADVAAGLAGLVEQVLERLGEEGLPKTRLAEDWAVLGRLDDEEKDFCAAAARLGLDPFDVSDELASEIVDVAGGLLGEVVGDFFDNADAGRLRQAAEWARRASAVATTVSAKARSDLADLHGVAGPYLRQEMSVHDKPWETGYAVARRVRRELDVSETDQFDVSPWLAVGEVDRDPAGMQGLVVVDHGRCGLALGSPSLAGPGRAFAQARALGRALVRPAQRCFLLSAASSHDERMARAFAAELLAPAQGIRAVLNTLGKQDDLAFEVVARQFGVSPLVVRHQYDNQLARTSP